MQCFWLFDRFFGSGLCDDWTCVCYMNWFREYGEVGTYQELERVVQDRRLCPVGRVGVYGSGCLGRRGRGLLIVASRRQVLRPAIL